MSERRGFKDQISDVLTESLPDASDGTLEKWLAPTTESRIEEIPVERIRDRAVRGDVDVTEPTYRALRASIRASGVLQPLLLRPVADGEYEVVSGARRLRAARDTAQMAVPAVVRELSDVQALVGGSWDAVLRSGLSPRESRDLVAQLVTAGMGEGEATALVGTAPVREDVDGAAAAEADPAAAAAVEVAVDAAPAPEADVADAPTSAEAAAPAAETESDAAVGETEADAAEMAAAETESDGAAPAAVVAAPEVDDAGSGAAVAETAPVDAAVAGEPSEVTETPVADVEASVDAPAADTVRAPDDAERSPDGSAAVEPDLDFDEDAMGWPAPDDAPAATAPTTPPAALPIDPTRFPLAPLDGEHGAPEESPALPTETATNGASPAIPSTEAPAAEAPAVTEPETVTRDAAPEAPAAEAPAATEPEAVTADASPEAPAAEAPEATESEAVTGDASPEAPAAEAPATTEPETVTGDAASPDAPAVPEPTSEVPAAPAPGDTPTAAPSPDEPADDPVVVVAPVDAAAAAGVTPHVIRINLPAPETETADDEPAATDGSMPVAAPAATADADTGSRLVAPAGEVDSTTAPTPSRSALPVPALLRRGPLFYAVLGIGLAVGAIVFILTSVLEGVGGTTSIIAAVVVAVVGFVTAMVSLAQPRSRA